MRIYVLQIDITQSNRTLETAMASARQLKALIKSHIEGDETHFYSIAMQMAAHEARLGHGKLAQELRALIDEAKKNRASSSPARQAHSIVQATGRAFFTAERVLSEITPARYGA